MIYHDLQKAGQIIGFPKTAVPVDTPSSLKMHVTLRKAYVTMSYRLFSVTIRRIDDGCTVPIDSCASKVRSYSSWNTKLKLAFTLRPIGNPRKMFGKSVLATGVVTVSSGY